MLVPVFVWRSPDDPMTRPAGLAPGGASGARTLLRLAPARAGGRGPRRRAGPGRAVRDAGPSRLPDRVRARALDVRAAPGALGTGAAVRSARADKMAAMGLAGVADQAAIDVFDKGARQARGAPRRPRGRQRRGPGPQPARSHRPARPGRVRSPGVEPPPAAKAPADPPPTGDNERLGHTPLRHPGRQPLAD